MGHAPCPYPSFMHEQGRLHGGCRYLHCLMKATCELFCRATFSTLVSSLASMQQQLGMLSFGSTSSSLSMYVALCRQCHYNFVLSCLDIELGLDRPAASRRTSHKAGHPRSVGDTNKCGGRRYRTSADVKGEHRCVYRYAAVQYYGTKRSSWSLQCEAPSHQLLLPFWTS